MAVSWRYGARAAEPPEASGEAARNTAVFQSPSPHSLAASPLLCRLRRQNFISRALTIPPATQAKRKKKKLASFLDSIYKSKLNRSPCLEEDGWELTST